MADEIVWLSSNKKSKYSDHYNLLIESGFYKSISVPPNVILSDKDCELTQYYLMRLQEEYVGNIVILDEAQVFISKDNSI